MVEGRFSFEKQPPAVVEDELDEFNNANNILFSLKSNDAFLRFCFTIFYYDTFFLFFWQAIFNGKYVFFTF